ncbi:hypothetical protein IV203_025784 [Nitzschia inconspicua]|uniref:Uncharacterized protein n=1 Tax=Nitzschia inconspicua TaxID=303405 RepID=A0A9K3LIA1_9STRA|nr:hypothetical protein IV203_025784 [Nitzschia inconspicua]
MNPHLSAITSDYGVVLSNGIPPRESDDDEDTFEETLEGTLEGTIVETPRLPSSTEMLILNATKAMVLAVARTAPVQISPSMAFSNAIDMDNLCRVRTEDTTYSTVYNPGKRFHRRHWRGKCVVSNGNMVADEEDIEDETDESMTIQSWNTMLTNRPSDDEEEDVSQEDNASHYAVNIETTMYQANGKPDHQDGSQNPREQAEDMVIFKAEAEADGVYFTGKNNGRLGKSEEKTPLTIQHQTEHAEIVVNNDKLKAKKKCNGGRRIVRFFTPIARILTKNKRSERPSSLNDTSSVSMMQSFENHIAFGKPEDEPISTDSSTMMKNLEHSSLVESEPYVDTVGSERSTKGEDETERSIVTIPSFKRTHKELNNDDPKDIPNDSSSAFIKFQEVVRDASEENGFEVEVSSLCSTFMARPLIRCDSSELNERLNPAPFQTARSTQSVRKSVCRFSTLQSSTTIVSKMDRSQSLPSKSFCFLSKAAVEEPSKENSTDSKSLDTRGSYCDDDESTATPLIVPSGMISVNKEASCLSADKRLHSKSRFDTRSLSLKRALSVKSFFTHKRPEHASEQIINIEDVPEHRIEEKTAMDESMNKEVECARGENETSTQEKSSKACDTNLPSPIEEVFENGPMIADTDERVNEEYSKVDPAGILVIETLELENKTSPESPHDEATSISIAVGGISYGKTSAAEKQREKSQEKKEEDENDGDYSRCCSNKAEENELVYVNGMSYVVTSTVEEEVDCDTYSTGQLPGFEVSEIPTKVNDLIEIKTMMSTASASTP